MKFYTDLISYNKKPDSNVVGIIRNNIKRMYGRKYQNSLQVLIKSIESGKTIQLGIYDVDGKFQEQSIVMLDFDNPTQNKAELLYIQNNKFIQENACFIYKSFSYKEHIPKFRVVFLLDKPVYKEDDVKKIYKGLLSEFPQADKVVGQPNRLFFGSNQSILEINFNNRLKIDNYLNLTLDNNKNKDNKSVRKKINKKPIDDLIIPKLNTEETVTNDFNILNEQFTIIQSAYDKEQYDKYYNLPIYKLFKLHKFNVIKQKFFEKFGKEFSYTFPDPINASKIFKHELDMIEFLELPVDEEGKAFSDIFSEDNSPSACVYRHEKSNVQLYKRFNSENEALQTFDLILLISTLTKMNYITVAEKLIEITGSIIDVNSNVYKHKMGVKMFQMFISESETDDLYPYFMHIIRPNTAVIITLLDIMSHSYKQVGNEVMLLNNMSVRYLTNQVNRIHHSNHTPQKIAKILDQLAMFAVTKKLKDSEVPKQILSPLVSQKTDKQFKNRANITKVNVDKDNVTDILSDGNIKSKNLIENNYSMKMMNFEFILNVLGEQEAMNIYPQKFTHKQESIDDENKKYYQEKMKSITINILNIAYKHINEKGYVLEKDLKKEYMSLGFSDRDFIMFKPKLKNEYGLTRLRFSNNRKIEYNALDVDGYPYFYVQ